jgi:hypothetical protein
MRRMVLLVAVAMAGCGSKADPASDLLVPGSRAILFDEKNETVYVGQMLYGVPVGTEVTVVSDPGAPDPETGFRKVTINVPTSAMDPLRRPPGAGFSAKVFRDQLRPAK